MPGPFTLAQIASRLGGRIAGDPEILISQVGSLERAGRGQIAFLSNPKYRSKLAATRASAVILAADAEAHTARGSGRMARMSATCASTLEERRNTSTRSTGSAISARVARNGSPQSEVPTNDGFTGSTR